MLARFAAVLLAGLALGRDLPAQATAPKANGSLCTVALIEGEAAAGQGFERPLGNGLKVMLEPLASGWLLRVLPATGPRGAHDYAELATPPYQAVNPLLLSTDFSFRAQDAVAWNPRRFHYAASAAEFARLSAAYAEYTRSAAPSPRAEADLAALAARTPEGVVQILDARLVPGTANQAQTAAMVASHFATTPHTIEQPADGQGTPLGRVTWLRFRLSFALPAGFEPARGLKVQRAACP